MGLGVDVLPDDLQEKWAEHDRKTIEALAARETFIQPCQAGVDDGVLLQRSAAVLLRVLDGEDVVERTSDLAWNIWSGFASGRYKLDEAA